MGTIRQFLSQVQPKDLIVVHWWNGAYYEKTPVPGTGISKWLRGVTILSCTCTWQRVGKMVDLYI